MDRDELNERNAAAIRRWWTTMRDSGRVEPRLLDDLAAIADEHAREYALSIEEGHRGEHAPVRREERAEAATPPLAAADLAEAVKTAATVTAGTDSLPPLKTSSPGPLPGPSARTRTRTRGGSQ